MKEYTGWTAAELQDKNISAIIGETYNISFETIYKDFLTSDASIGSFRFNIRDDLLETSRDPEMLRLDFKDRFGINARAQVVEWEKDLFLAFIQSLPIELLVARYATAGFAMFDNDFRIVEFNERLYELTENYEQRSSLRYRPLSQIILEEDWRSFIGRRERWQAHLAECAEKDGGSWIEAPPAVGTKGNWNAFPENGWKIGEGKIVCLESQERPGYAVSPHPLHHVGMDIRMEFNVKSGDFEGFGVFMLGKLDNFMGTPDEGGLLAVVHGNRLEIKEDCEHVGFSAFPVPKRGTWHHFALQKTGSLVTCRMDGKEIARSPEISPHFPEGQRHSGFFARHGTEINDLRVFTRLSAVDYDLRLPRHFDVRFKKLPSEIFQMEITKRRYGQVILNGAIFERVTELRKKENALLRSEQAREALSRENIVLRDRFRPDQKWIISRSPAMGKIYRIIGEVAPTRASVLIQGETGTGKEVIAHMIHAMGLKPESPFIKIDCAALPETLLESELFGHEKGAFTGAVARRAGRFELADQGTVFLDEIANIGPSIQVKLLRILQDGAFERLGGMQTLKSDFRLICATNEDLEKLVARERFRSDLFYRINVVTVKLPPLRERREDTGLFAHRFLEEFSAAHHKEVRGFAPEAMEFIMRYDWPGNIRELRNVIEQSVLLSAGPQVSRSVLEQSTSSSAPSATRGPGPSPEAGGKPIHIEKAVIVNSRAGLDIVDLNRLLGAGGAPSLSKADRNGMPAKRDICHGLKKFRGSVSRTAEHLGVKVPRLYYLMKIMGISGRDFKPGRRRNPPA